MNGESDDKNTLEVDQPVPSDTNGNPRGRDSPATDRRAPSKRQSCCPRFLADLKWSRFPHVTLLPGLQFSLAGIIGKPQTFYQARAKSPRWVHVLLSLFLARSVFRFPVTFRRPRAHLRCLLVISMFLHSKSVILGLRLRGWGSSRASSCSAKL